LGGGDGGDGPSCEVEEGRHATHSDCLPTEDVVKTVPGQRHTRVNKQLSRTGMEGNRERERE